MPLIRLEEIIPLTLDSRRYENKQIHKENTGLEVCFNVLYLIWILFLWPFCDKNNKQFLIVMWNKK